MFSRFPRANSTNTSYAATLDSDSEHLYPTHIPFHESQLNLSFSYYNWQNTFQCDIVLLNFYATVLPFRCKQIMKIKACKKNVMELKKSDKFGSPKLTNIILDFHNFCKSLSYVLCFSIENSNFPLNSRIHSLFCE